MAFFRKNKKENKIIDEQKQQKDVLKQEVTNISEEDYGLSPEVAQAIDNIIPVISNGDLNLIPSVYKSDVLAASIDAAPLHDLLILADYTHTFASRDEKGEHGFAPTFLNCLAAGIATKIKNASVLYTIYSNVLKNPYPLVAPGFALIFFDESNAKDWAEIYTKEHESNVYVKALEGGEIKTYFEELLSLGIGNIGIEPGISKITINHQPIFGASFETAANPAVQFLSLRFIQLDKSKIYHDKAKNAHGALLSAIIASKFICPGKTVNGKFIAASLSRGETSFLSVFTDKKELQNTMDENPTAKEFLSKAELKILSFAELEEFLMSPHISALTINISGMGFTIRRDIYENLFKAIKANPGKQVAIQVE